MQKDSIDEKSMQYTEVEYLALKVDKFSYNRWFLENSKLGI